MKKILFLLMFCLISAGLYAKVIITNLTPFPIRVVAHWDFNNYNNKANNPPLYLGPGQTGNITGDGAMIKRKYWVGANQYGNNYEDLRIDQKQNDAGGHVWRDVGLVTDANGNLALRVMKHR